MGSVVLAKVRRGATISPVGVFGVVGLGVFCALGCGTSSSPRSPGTGGSGTSNGSGGSGTSTQGGSDTAPQGGSDSNSQGGASTGSGGASGGVLGSGGTVNASGGTASGGALTSNGGTSTGSGGVSAAAGAAGACQMATYKFEPKIPTLYVMVDRSGSMFDCLSTTNPEPSCKTPEDTAWVKLKTAALSVIDAMQADVRFGFAAFTGTNEQSNGTCPMIDQVEPALNNYAAIKAKYDSLPFQPETTEPGKKFETPARESLDLIGDKLLKDTTPGDKFILFVTDGQPDYCDDSNVLCAPDSVIAGLQGLRAKNVTTIVMGLQSAANDLPPGILQAFTNAGLGEDTVAPLRMAQNTDAFYDQCNGVAGWHADLVASGKTAERGVTLGTYAATAGPTKPLAPSAADQAMIVSVLQRPSLA